MFLALFSDSLFGRKQEPNHPASKESNPINRQIEVVSFLVTTE
jgi:hypothetical protein